jgi:L-gulonate 3-dehydrogenase
MAAAGVIGAGLVGRAWAMVFARAGWDVALYDSSADARAQAPALIAQSLAEMATHGLVDDPAAIAKRIRVVATVADAVAGPPLLSGNFAPSPHPHKTKKNPI